MPHAPLSASAVPWSSPQLLLSPCPSASSPRPLGLALVAVRSPPWSPWPLALAPPPSFIIVLLLLSAFALTNVLAALAFSAFVSLPLIILLPLSLGGLR